MNIRQYFIEQIMKKQSPMSMSVHDSDLQYLQTYLEPIKEVLGKDFDQLCQAIFTIFKNQVSVFTHDQSASAQSFMEAFTSLHQQHPVLADAEAMKAATSPEALAAIQATQENPDLMNVYKVGLLSALLGRHPEHAQQISKDKKTPLKLSDWITNIVATKSTQGHEELAHICAEVSFESFRTSFQIHSAQAELAKFLELDLQKDFAEQSTLFPMIPKTTWAEFKSDFIKVYEAIEQQHDVFSAPLIEEAYAAYQEIVVMLSNRLSKGPKPAALISSEHAFSHLPREKEGVTSQADFQSAVIDASRVKPVLVDFWATWCAPCKRLGPVIDDISKTQQALLSVVKIDVDKASEITATQNVRSLPTLALYYQGKDIGRITGFQDKQAILSFISERLAKEASPQ